MAPPHSHPFNPLIPLRASCADLTDGQRVKLVDGLFRATWAEGRAVTGADVVGAVAAECGLDAPAILAQAQSDAVKARLHQHAEEALKIGVFGVPTMRVRGELFWGFDDLEYLGKFLEGRDPLPADRASLKAWFEIKPSAVRKG